MDNIDYTILKYLENIFTDLDINKYVEYGKLSQTKWNNNFINDYIKNVLSENYDKLLEKSVQLCLLSYFSKNDIKNILKNINIIYSKDYDTSKYYIIHNKTQNNIIII